MNDLHRQVERISITAEKLLNETIRLRRDVARLHGRIEPFEDEQRIVDPPVVASRHRNLKDALDTIEAARESIRDSEYALNVIEGRINEIASAAVSREEMRPWLKGGGT